MSRRAELTGAILATFAIQAVGVLYYNFLFKQSYIETRERVGCQRVAGRNFC